MITHELAQIWITSELDFVWITSDGKRFLVKGEAVAHEERLNIQDEELDIVTQWIKRIKGE